MNFNQEQPAFRVISACLALGGGMLRTVLAEVHILICQVVVKQDEISEV